MRSVKKETMDELARITRKYWATGDKGILDAKHKKASELSEQAFGSDANWLQFCDILDGVICLNRNVSNDTIYKIFGLLCIEVSALRQEVYSDDEDRTPLSPLSDPDFEYDRRLELRDEFHGADLTREDIHLGAGLLEDE